MTDPTQLKDLMLSRRSVYPNQYSGDKVPRSAVEQILEVAHWAPNHGRTEPWEFRVYEGTALKQLGEIQARIYREKTSDELFQESKYEKLLNRPTEASHVIVICMKRGEKPTIPVIEEVEAVATAVQNMWLMTTALGYGGYWSTGGGTYQSEFHQWLGLGEEDQCLGFFYLGVPAGKLPPGRRSASWEEKVTWVCE